MSELLWLAGSAFLGISGATILAVRNGQAALHEAKDSVVKARRWFEDDIDVGPVSEEWLSSNAYTRGQSGDTE